MNKKNVSLTLGSAFVVSLAVAPVVNAGDNPFGVGALSEPLRVAEADMKAGDGKCGEGKCGGKSEADSGDAKTAEGSCGGKKADTSEQAAE